MSSQRRHLSNKQGEESLRRKTTFPEFLSGRTLPDNVNFTLRTHSVVTVCFLQGRKAVFAE